MRTRFPLVFVTALLAQPAIALGQATEIRTWNQAVRFQNIATVSVTLFRGTIAVRTTDADSISVSIMGRGKADQSAEEWFRSTGITLTTTSDAFRLVNPDTAQVMQPGITLNVPRSLKGLNLNINKSGQIYVTGFSGSLSASTPDGDVILEHISGTALVNVREGDIRMTSDKLPPKESVGIELLANNGNIILTIPERSSTKMLLEASHGAIFSDFLSLQFRPFAGRLVSDGHGFVISTTVGSGVDYKGEWNARNSTNRMDVDYKVESSTYMKDGGSLTPIHLATINGSIIITKGWPNITLGKPF